MSGEFEKMLHPEAQLFEGLLDSGVEGGCQQAGDSTEPVVRGGMPERRF
jgi:hypothetical protein